MKFAIITHVSHGFESRGYFAYAPYVREMNIWLKYADQIIIVAPLEQENFTPIDAFYNHQQISFKKIPSFDIKSVLSILKTCFLLPIVFYRILSAMRAADHIHLRCPGNIGLVGCFAQMFFPTKKKTAKYAGNWDPNSDQPFSYKVQKWILSNTFLTRNMQVLVYGEWPNQTKNIKPFFTATYSDSDKIILPKKSFTAPFKMIFVGTLSEGKRPLYALKIVELLLQKGVDIRIDFYGEGSERQHLENFIQRQNLQNAAKLHGNQDELVVREAYKNSHFLNLSSKSEGWPKVVAEAMFWGVVPIASSVSCVPTMLNFGERGVLLTLDLEHDAENFFQIINDEDQIVEKSEKAKQWSRYFTLDLFEQEIKNIMQADLNS